MAHPLFILVLIRRGILRAIFAFLGLGNSSARSPGVAGLGDRRLPPRRARDRLIVFLFGLLGGASFGGGRARPAGRAAGSAAEAGRWRRLQRRRRQLRRRRRERLMVIVRALSILHAALARAALVSARDAGENRAGGEALERLHRGEIRFRIEASLTSRGLRLSTRQRARQVFAQLGVWDTGGEQRRADLRAAHRPPIEIVADRGIAAKVQQSEWDAICRAMDGHSKPGRFAEGS